MIPSLLRPLIYGFRNRWHCKVRRFEQIGRDLLVILLATSLAWSIYSGTVWALIKIRAVVDIAYLPAAHPIGLICSALLVMLLISNIVIAMSVLLFGRDLELVLSAPLSKASFFLGKSLIIIIASSWMSAVFLIPFLLAFATVYRPEIQFYLMAVLLMFPFFSVPAALAIIIVVAFAVLIPVRRTKEILWFCLLSVGYIVFALFRLLGEFNLSRGSPVAQLMGTLGLLAMPEYNWLPSNWLARIFQEILEPNGTVVVYEVVLLFSVAYALLAAAYLTVANLHHLAYSRAFGSGLRAVVHSTKMRPWILNRIVSPVRGIIMKELRTATREMSQVLQLLVLLGIGLIYLYNIRVLSSADALTGIIAGMRWKSFIFVINSAMGAFITTAICTRLVFPSVSLEGRALWIIKQSPLTERQFLLAKFFSWLVPVAIISWVVNAVSIYFLASTPVILSVSSYSSICSAVGIVGVAVGLGAVFHNFQWEYSSQLQASFGSLIFMLLSVVLIAINQVPTGLMLLIVQTQVTHLFSINSNLVFIFCSIFMILINCGAAHLALQRGCNRLQKSTQLV